MPQISLLKNSNPIKLLLGGFGKVMHRCLSLDPVDADLLESTLSTSIENDYGEDRTGFELLKEYGKQLSSSETFYDLVNGNAGVPSPTKLLSDHDTPQEKKDASLRELNQLSSRWYLARKSWQKGEAFRYRSKGLCAFWDSRAEAGTGDILAGLPLNLISILSFSLLMVPNFFCQEVQRACRNGFRNAFDAKKHGPLSRVGNFFAAVLLSPMALAATATRFAITAVDIAVDATLTFCYFSCILGSFFAAQAREKYGEEQQNTAYAAGFVLGALLSAVGITAMVLSLGTLNPATLSFLGSVVAWAVGVPLANTVALQTDPVACVQQTHKTRGRNKEKTTPGKLQFTSHYSEDLTQQGSPRSSVAGSARSSSETESTETKNDTIQNNGQSPHTPAAAGNSTQPTQQRTKNTIGNGQKGNLKEQWSQQSATSSAGDATGAAKHDSQANNESQESQHTVAQPVATTEPPPMVTPVIADAASKNDVPDEQQPMIDGNTLGKLVASGKAFSCSTAEAASNLREQGKTVQEVVKANM